MTLLVLGLRLPVAKVHATMTERGLLDALLHQGTSSAPTS